MLCMCCKLQARVALTSQLTRMVAEVKLDMVPTNTAVLASAKAPDQSIADPSGGLELGVHMSGSCAVPSWAAASKAPAGRFRGQSRGEVKRRHRSMAACACSHQAANGLRSRFGSAVLHQTAKRHCERHPGKWVVHSHAGSAAPSNSRTRGGMVHWTDASNLGRLFLRNIGLMRTGSRPGCRQARQVQAAAKLGVSGHRQGTGAGRPAGPSTGHRHAQRPAAASTPALV